MFMIIEFFFSLMYMVSLKARENMKMTKKEQRRTEYNKRYICDAAHYGGGGKR